MGAHDGSSSFLLRKFRKVCIWFVRWFWVEKSAWMFFLLLGLWLVSIFISCFLCRFVVIWKRLSWVMLLFVIVIICSNR